MSGVERTQEAINREVFEASLVELLAELAENTRRIAEALERRNPPGVPTGRVDLAKQGGAP